ncbi:hypothetical protein CCR94_01805 [Rhodoblastus sphagnicola]|uniref:Uncharacterized protein n=1 Tax=Rhodoblastus sphagnicola TaxID=333368 RepID=A0A2S6NFN6_9HYPH|nr:hypothetical protein CCR94_01805 [Rhodoblastus sphagnicola]
MAPVADKLDADIVEMKSRIKGLTVPPNKVVGAAPALIEEHAGAPSLRGQRPRLRPARAA